MHTAGSPQGMLLSLLTLLLVPLAWDGGGRAAAAAELGDSGSVVDVSTIDGFLAALEDDAVAEVVLTGDLRLDQAADLGVLPIALNRDVTIAGPVPFNATAYPSLDQPGVPHLDFCHLSPVVAVGGNVSLALRDLVVEGIPPYDAPDVGLWPGYPQAIGLNTFPSIVLLDGAQVYVERYSTVKPLDSCSPSNFASSFKDTKALLGDSVELLPNNTVALTGSHTLPLPLRSSDGQAVGEATLHAVGPITYSCPQGSYQALGPGTGGGMRAQVLSVAGLMAALQAPNVTEIILAGTTQYSLGEAPDPGVLPITLTHNLTLAGPVRHRPDEFPLRDQPEVPHLDFSQRWPVLVVGRGVGLTYKDLILEGVPRHDVPEVMQSTYPQVPSLNSFPSTILEDGAQIRLQRVAAIRESSFCTPGNFTASIEDIRSLLGGDASLLLPNTSVVYRNHSLPLPLKSSNGQSVGTAQLDVEGPVTYTCTAPAATPAAQGTGSPQGDGGGLSAGAWAGIAVGVAAALAGAGVLAALAMRRRRRHRKHCTAAAALKAVTPPLGTSSSSDLRKDVEDGLLEAAGTPINAQRSQGDSNLGSLLRVRFGGMEGLEIGGLIGRGAFGRVYRGSLRGTTVAVKVVEHSRDDGGGDPAAEALLLCGLSHPNIVAVYRAATIRLQGAAPGGSSAGDSSWAVAPRPTSAPGVQGALGSPFELGGTQAVPAPAGHPASSSSEAGNPSGGNSRDMCTVNQVALEAAAIASAVRLSSGRTGTGPLVGGPLDTARGSSGTQAAAADSPGSPGTTSALASSKVSARAAAAEQYETWLALEFCERGSLEDAIRRGLLRRPDGSRREGLLLGILQDVAKGLCYLHEAGVVHGDLKPGNVLLRSAGRGNLVAKLADFGLSKLLPSDQHTLVRTQTLGTARYMPPELLRAGRLSRATDTYSYGILMLEVWTGRPALEEQNAAAIFFSVVHEGSRPAVPPDMPPGYAHLMQQCWAQAAQDRPSMQEVLARLRGIAAATGAAARRAAA